MKAPVPNGGQRWVPVLRIIQPGYFSLSDHSPGMDPARLKDNPAAGIRHGHWAHFLYAAYHRARDQRSGKHQVFSFQTFRCHESPTQRSPWGTGPGASVGWWRQWWPGDVQYIGDTRQVSAYKGHLSTVSLLMPPCYTLTRWNLRILDAESALVTQAFNRNV